MASDEESSQGVREIFSLGVLIQLIQTIDAIKDDLTLQKFVMKMASLRRHTNKPLCPDHDDEKDSDKGDDKEQ